MASDQDRTMSINLGNIWFSNLWRSQDFLTKDKNEDSYRVLQKIQFISNFVFLIPIFRQKKCRQNTVICKPQTNFLFHCLLNKAFWAVWSRYTQRSAHLLVHSPVTRIKWRATIENIFYRCYHLSAFFISPQMREDKYATCVDTRTFLERQWRLWMSGCTEKIRKNYNKCVKDTTLCAGQVRSVVSGKLFVTVILVE
jgi:hypothetical protein